VGREPDHFLFNCHVFGVALYFNLYIGGADMNITPAWQNAVRVYRIVIENPEISAEIKAEAWADLARLAREMDRENGGDHHDH